MHGFCLSHSAHEQVKYAIHEEQKVRMQYLKETEYGKEYLMRKAEVSSVVVDKMIPSKPGDRTNQHAA